MPRFYITVAKKRV